MSKELEALERIRRKLSVHYNIDKIYEWSIIDDDFSDIEKSLKALEIIKEKKVNIGYLLLCDDYEEYLDDFNDRQGEGNLPSFELLTKEEYDLLKENE